MCLKKLKGLSKVHLVDAGFVWTEPHSKRVKVKLTIQKEVSERKRCDHVISVSCHVTVRCRVGPSCSKCLWWSTQSTITCVMSVIAERPTTSGGLWYKSDRRSDESLVVFYPFYVC